MKKIGYVFVLGLVSVFTLSNCIAQKGNLAAVESGFLDVPDSIRVGCYWYWIADNISKEGVIKDLYAMKKAGITRAYIGNIGLSGTPFGKVKIFTPQWWDILHAALKTASKLDIEIGLFNSPGWSQSGGPWVKPSQSMRYLASIDTIVNGMQKIKWKLPVISDSSQLVKILAYPTKKEIYSKSFALKGYNSKADTIDMMLDRDAVIRSFFFTTRNYIWTNAELQAQVGNTFKTVRKFVIDRTKFQKLVGFDPYAPVALSLPGVRSSKFRLILSKPFQSHGDVEAVVKLSSDQVVERYPEKSLAKMFQRPNPMWDAYMWPRLNWSHEKSPDVVNVDDVRDISAFLTSDSIVSWEAPKGRWTISAFLMKPTGITNNPATPDATGLEVDKMSKKHVADHFKAFLGEMLHRIPEEDRKSFRIAVLDSYEAGGQNWTDDMKERFERVYGYDPDPYLPVLDGVVVGNEDMSSRFLWDLRRLIADRIAKDYVGGLTEISHRYGLTTWLENYGHWGFPAEFLQYGGQSDEVGGEFWGTGDLGEIENRAASSSAHIYGKNRVWAESFTSRGPNFTHYPLELKQRIDKFFTQGINATILHVYIHQPYEDKTPGISAWFGSDFQRKNTWFGQLDLFTNYIRRANWMLQQGTYVADVAYFIGEDAPKMTGAKDDPALPYGYSFDYINAEVLLQKARVDNGYLVVPGGIKYKLLILPDEMSMRPEVLKKLSEFVKDGLAIYGNTPTYSPSLSNYPDADKEVSLLGQKMFASNKFGKGSVYRRSVSINYALKDLGIKPDFYTSSDSILFIHRSLNDGEIYFLSNQSSKKANFEGSFRVKGGLKPELWNAITGEIRALPDFKLVDSRTVVPLQLDSNGSAFIVFRHRSRLGTSVSNFPKEQRLITLNHAWRLKFQKDRRGPVNEVQLSSLIDWKDSPNDSIKYFSGEVTYKNVFNVGSLPKGTLYLDLGNVMVMAKVRLNGKEIGGVWTTPYRLNITKSLKVGSNELEITVVNNWRNRLIGDQHMPPDKRGTWTTVNPWKKDSPLQPSGLLGPVEIVNIQY